MSGDDIAYLSYLGILLFFIGSGFLYSRRGRLSQTLQQAAIWGLIFVAVIIAYGFSDTLQSQLFPSRASQISAGSYALERQSDGHFYLTLKVNSKAVEFIVDTGATQIVLSKEVNDGELDGSLLGMTYLSRFQELSIRGNTMTLTR